MGLNGHKYLITLSHTGFMPISHSNFKKIFVQNFGPKNWKINIQKEKRKLGVFTPIKMIIFCGLEKTWHSPLT